MTALKQLAFSLAFAITAVAAAQYIMGILNGQPGTPPRAHAGAKAQRQVVPDKVAGDFDSR